MYKDDRGQPGGADSPAQSDTRFPAPVGDSDRISIGELAREACVTVRALRFNQSKGLLSPQRDGNARVFDRNDRARLNLILQGKRLSFTLSEIRAMVGKRGAGAVVGLPHQRRDLDQALAELRQIYTGMYVPAVMP